MDYYNESILKLRQYLKEASLEEKAAIWQEIRQLDLKGPTVEEYFDGLQQQLADFNLSFEQISIKHGSVTFGSQITIGKVNLNAGLFSEEGWVCSTSEPINSLAA